MSNGSDIVIYPSQRRDTPAAARVHELETFCARPRVLVAIEEARLGIARRTCRNAVEYLGCRADLPLMEAHKRSLREQRDSRKCKLGDRVELDTAVRAANYCGLVREAID